MRPRLLPPALAVLLFVVGCSAAAPSVPPATTYELPPRTVRPDESALKVGPVKNGEIEFTVIGLAAGMESITGSHGEMPSSSGQFVRIRLVVTNTGTSNAQFDYKRQLLVDDKGGTHPPDEQAMLIKRQPTKFDLGRGVRLEFDLYWDIAKALKPVALRVLGDPTLADTRNLTGTDIRIG